MNYTKLAYARLNFDFDHELFVYEYDQKILPLAQFINNGKKSRLFTRKLNQIWNMVDPVLYNKDKTIQWEMTQLMYLITDEQDLEVVKGNPGLGGTYMRNMHLDREWRVKPEFETLEIVNFIQTLPFSKIVSMHCVSLEPGRFANIHRDTRYTNEIDRPNIAINNGVYSQGYVVLTLNVSDGGVPLYWALDGDATNHVIKTNDPAYLISDYFLHGVPACTSRRRQIRVTGIPTPELQSLIDHNNKIELPENYNFDPEDRWYPG